MSPLTLNIDCRLARIPVRGTFDGNLHTAAV